MSHISLRQVQGRAMPSLQAPARTSEKSSVEDCLSWRKLAAAVRRRARYQADEGDLLKFADLLDAFAELEDLSLNPDRNEQRPARPRHARGGAGPRLKNMR
jgi:hypothetical protein